MEIAKKVSQKNLMTEGSVFKNIFLFSIPLILGNLLQQMYNAVDSIIVGNYVGSSGLAAVGSSTTIISLLIAFSMGASTGAGIIVSQFLGAKDKKRIQISVHTALGISIVLGIILSILGFIFTPKILILMRTPQNVINESIIYSFFFKYFSGYFIYKFYENGSCRSCYCYKYMPVCILHSRFQIFI